VTIANVLLSRRMLKRLPLPAAAAAAARAAAATWPGLSSSNNSNLSLDSAVATAALAEPATLPQQMLLSNDELYPYCDLLHNMSSSL